MTTTKKITAITIRIWQYKCFFIADVFDETKQYRGDCLSYKREDIDSWIAEWMEHADKVTIEDTTKEVSHV